MPHRDVGLAADRAIEAEAEQPGSPLLYEFVNGNIVADRLSDLRQAAMEAHHRIEKAVHRLPSCLEIDPQKAAEE